MSKFHEYYNEETINNYVDNTPVPVLLNQVSKYTKKQISILHEIPDPLPRKVDLLKLYDKASKLNDDNALTILLEKYNIDKYFVTDEDLPELSDEQCEKKIAQIVNYIGEINPKVDYQNTYKEKSNRIALKSRWRQFIKTDSTTKQTYLDAKLYLEALPRYSLEWATHWLNIRGIMKMNDDELIKTILEHKDKDSIILKCIKHHCGGIYFKMYVIEMLESGDYLIK